MYNLKASDGRNLSSQIDIEEEIIKFYDGLVGSAATRLKSINIVAMRNGKQLLMKPRQNPIAPMNVEDIFQAFRSIDDLTASGVDGYGVQFFKATWCTTKTNVVQAIHDFFGKDKLYSVVNSSLVTLTPKYDSTTTIKDYKPISCCSIIYKIVAKIMAARLGNF